MFIFPWKFRPLEKESGVLGRLVFVLALAVGAPKAWPVDVLSELRVGRACHAFDHLGSLGHQAEAAAASGATIIYASGLGGDGYSGLPAPDVLEAHRRAEAEYVKSARGKGVHLILGYLCATSIVGLDSFDTNWTTELRAQFRTPPSEWRQQNRQGQWLPSWYGGAYQAACMNNPDWRAYERFMVRQQLETGHDGIFFDNPTVHPKGCYCKYCMKKFAAFLEAEGTLVPDRGTETLRKIVEARPKDFMRFRCTMGRDFLSEMRAYARTVNSEAIVTANNSLNSADALYAQCRTYAYNIFEMSQAEDLIVVEDMGHQPRILPNGNTLEYGPTYKQLQAISHGRPVVAVTIAENDYHTPPNLVRLAMAEAAAVQASYVVWTTWPENVRPKMIAATRRQSDFLKRNQRLLNETHPRRDVILFLPFRRWTETSRCAVSELAQRLGRANVQYEVVSEDNFRLSELQPARLLLAESRSVFTSGEKKVLSEFEGSGGVVATADRTNWITGVKEEIRPREIVLKGPPTLRAYVRDGKTETVIHLLNLAVARLSSFEDEVRSAADVGLDVWVPLKRVRSVLALTADEGGSAGTIPYEAHPEGEGMRVEVVLPKIEVATMIVVEH